MFWHVTLTHLRRMEICNCVITRRCSGIVLETACWIQMEMGYAIKKRFWGVKHLRHAIMMHWPPMHRFVIFQICIICVQATVSMMQMGI